MRVNTTQKIYTTNMDAFNFNANENCTGLVFKAEHIDFMRSDLTLVTKTSLRLMRRKSCKCSSCDGLLETLHTNMIENGIRPITPVLQHKKLYTLKMVNIQKDWESGHIDYFDLEYVLLE